ncbi:MAG: DUF4421 domain-containing protein [Muribaculaceae bacterium]
MEYVERQILMLILLVITVVTPANVAAEAESVSDLSEMPCSTTDEMLRCDDSTRVQNTDSLIMLRKLHANDYWKQQLMKGKLDLYDESITYPSFLQMCVNLYRWGDRTFNSYDPDYVTGTGYKCKAIVKNEEWLESYAMRFPQKVNLGMMTNISSNLGAYVSYMAVSLGYSQEMNVLFGNKRTGQKKFELQFTCSRFAAEFYYNENRGGTNIHHFGDYNDGKWFTDEFPGLSQESYGVDVYYFFNNRKYSQGAAYNFSKYQKRSAGSLIGGLTISHQNIGLDFASLSDELKALLPEDKTIYRFKYDDYCFLLGYGYNWVFKPNWLFNVSMLPSVGFKHCFADNIDGYGNIFSLNIKGKLGLVYNHKRFFYGLGLRFDGHWYRSKHYGFFNSIEILTLTAGFRFDIF